MKKLLSIVISTLLLLSLGVSSVSATEISSIGTEEELAQQLICEEMDEKYREIFKDEFEFLGQYYSTKSLDMKPNITSIGNNQEPIVDSEKWVENDYYHLILYPNGDTVYTGFKGGTLYHHPDGEQWVNREAYVQFGNPSYMGHYFSTIISWTTLYSAYDQIDNVAPGGHSGPSDGPSYIHSQKTKENSSGPAYVNWHYRGRTSFYYDPLSEQYITNFDSFYFKVNVGNNTVNIDWGLR
ncbi:MAG TPA: hypothetical protein VFD00_09800 [Thermoclostridium sp.]|nr:hypothetical protein [Thermoclostridium sp.]